MDELGARVRGFRHARGLTGSALARQAGIDAGQLSRIEHGQAKRPGHRTLANLAEALGVSVAELTGRPEPELVTLGEEFTTALRWAAFAPHLGDIDVERHLRTLTKLSPAARADIVAYARWRGQQEYVAARGAHPPRPFAEAQGEPPRVLGEPTEDEPRPAQAAS